MHVARAVPELTYPYHFLARLEKRPDGALVVDPTARYEAGYEAHHRRVLDLAAGMAAVLGMERGDRFAVLSANSYRYLELWHAALFGAAIITPLNVRLSAPEIAEILADSGATVCFVDRDYADLVASVREKTMLRHVVLLGDGDVPCDIGYESLLAAAGRAPEPPEESDVAALVYTGGTTGRPKGVMLTQRALVLNQYHAHQVTPTPPGWRFLQHAPMYHVGACIGVLRMSMAGGTDVILPSFRATEFRDAVQRHRIQFTVLLPTLIAMILADPAFAPGDLASLRRISYGGSPMPPALLDRLRGLYPDLELNQVYGMTESAASLTMLTGDDHRAGGRRLNSVGRPLPGVRISVRGPEGTALPAGAEGEIWAQGGNLMSGYWGKPAETRAAFRDGWYRTGDIGRLDEDGYLFILDRAKDMIVSGGENVYSAEVERAVASHPAVAQVAVIGVPDPKWGETVCAIVVPAPGAGEVSAEEIIAHARRSIAGYKVPKLVEFRTEPLPVSGANKVLKQQLRATYRDHLS
ncbi:MAG TPA: AMP-binding protein [Amycolatopsis sp.]|nr:AMP-binding protein [Amycolatopsis sp.]